LKDEYKHSSEITIFELLADIKYYYFNAICPIKASELNSVAILTNIGGILIKLERQTVIPAGFVRLP
jgi:hypothetical protein